MGLTYAQEQLQYLEYANEEDIDNYISLDARPLIGGDVICDQCGKFMIIQQTISASLLVYLCPRCSRVIS